MADFKRVTCTLNNDECDCKGTCDECSIRILMQRKALMNAVNALDELKRINPKAFIKLKGDGAYCGCTLNEVEIRGNDMTNQIMLEVREVHKCFTW